MPASGNHLLVRLVLLELGPSPWTEEHQRPSQSSSEHLVNFVCSMRDQRVLFNERKKKKGGGGRYGTCGTPHAGIIGSRKPQALEGDFKNL